MKSVLDGDLVLKKQQKDKLKIVRDGIRKIVNNNEDLENHLDKDMENAIKLILNISNSTFPSWEKIKREDDSSSDNEPESSSDNAPSSDDVETD